MSGKQPLYVVRRDFKAGGDFYPVGTVIDDPDSVPLFKIRLHDNLIAKVPLDDETRLLDLRNFFELRHGINLDEIIAAVASKGSKVAEPTNSGASAIPPTPGTPESPTPTKPVAPSKPEVTKVAATPPVE